MVLWPGSMWCTTSAQVAPGALPLFTLRDLRILKRQWSEPTAWSWTGDASEWIIPLPNVPIPPHQEYIWAVQLTMVEVAAAAVAAAAAGGGETPIMIVAMTATTDMTSMTIGIVASALHHPTTVDTGLAHGPAPTAHGDTKLLFTTFSFPPIIGGV